MHALRIIWVGKTAKGYAQAGVDYFTDRIRALQPIDIVELRAAAHSGREVPAALEAEGAAILKRLEPQERVVLLDEGGEEMTSRQFAQWLAERQPVTFVLGGAHGLAGSIRQRAQHKLSLSRLTFPHQLARVVLLEQIYRALTLRRGHGYHHE
jgi:23S rRNA (pseudouridine1915-N3)-methyltransferase